MRTVPITYLFVPGDRPERFEKALASGADVVVIDLEDAVAPESKAAARKNVERALSAGSRACVRINSAETPWFSEDLQILRLPGVLSVMVPKAESARVLADAGAMAPQARLLPLVETARGLGNILEIAKAPNVERLAFGSVDFQVDMGIEGEDTELLFARSQMVLASRLAGIAAPIDGVTVDVQDVAQTRSDAHRARRLGFGAKLCIHPAQLAAVREAFTPDAKAIAWAKGVLEAVASTPQGALTYEGKLVDKPVVDRARSIIARIQ